METFNEQEYNENDIQNYFEKFDESLDSFMPYNVKKREAQLMEEFNDSEDSEDIFEESNENNDNGYYFLNHVDDVVDEKNILDSLMPNNFQKREARRNV